MSPSATLPQVAPTGIAAFADTLPVHPLYGPAGAGVYDAVAVHDLEEPRLVAALSRGVTGPVVDLAAGSGRVSLPLAARGLDVIAVDDSPAMLALLGQRLADAGDRLRGTVQTVCADALDAEFPADAGLVVLAATSIGLFDEAGRAQLLTRIAGALAPQGRALISVADHRPQEPSETTTLLALPERGLLVTVVERVDPAAGHREVFALPAVVDGDPRDPVLLQSRIHLVDEPELRDVARGVGLRVRGRHPVPTAPGASAGAVLLDLELAR